jgi:hypothetical protein
VRTDKNKQQIKISVRLSKLLLLISTLLFSLTATSGLDFRTEDPIDFFSNTDMNQNNVRNLSKPVNSGDAVPLDYVQGKFVQRDGDTLQGNIDLNGNYIVNSPTVRAVPSYGLAGYWPFQKSGANVKDWSRYSNDGEVLGGEIVGGQVGGSIKFNGEGEGIQLESSSNNLEDESNISVSAWFKTQDSNGLILGSGSSQTSQGYWLAVKDGEIEFRATNQEAETVTVDTTIPLDEWQHVTATLGNGSVNLYLDGSLEATESFSGELAKTEGEKLYSGVLEPGASDTDQLPYDGRIDELRIYTEKVTSREVKTLYQMGINGRQEIGGAYLSRERGGSIYDNVFLKGRLDMSGNDVTNTGDVDGVDLDDPGNALQITNSSYEVIENSIENSELNNSKSIAVNGLNSTDNINLAGNNITNVEALKFISGASINGSINATGDINLNNGSLTNIESIDGGGDRIEIEDALDLNENKVVNINSISDNTGSDTIRLDGSGNVKIPSGNLDISGNQIEGIGSEGSYFNSAGDLVLSNNRSLKIESVDRALKVVNIDQSDNVEIGDDSTISNVEIPAGNLDIDGNVLRNAGRVSFQDKNQDSESLSIEESVGSGDLEVLNESGNALVSVEQSGRVKINSGNLDLKGNSLKSVDTVSGENSINKISLESGQGNNIELDALEGGNIKLRGGDLDLSGNSLTDTSGGNTVNIGDNSEDSVSIRAGGTGSFDVRTGDTSGSSISRLEITSATNQADLDVKNTNIDMNSNSIENYYGSQCLPGKSMIKVRENGSFKCRSISTQVSDLYVNREGDSMTGDLNMNDNQIDNVSRIGVKTPNPQQNLDVDGTASVQNSGTEMELTSNGDVVITLG